MRLLNFIKEDNAVGMAAHCLVGKLTAIDTSWHHDVREEKIDFVATKYLQGGGPGRRLQHSIPKLG